MGVRWNSLTDQTLLLKILETSSVNVDVKAVAAAWPQDLEKPTPRAISERLVKIRGMAKSSGTAAHFSVSRGNKSNKSTPSPRKAAARRPAAKKSGGVKKAGVKRKGRGKDLDDSDTDFASSKEETPEPDVIILDVEPNDADEMVGSDVIPLDEEDEESVVEI